MVTTSLETEQLETITLLEEAGERPETYRPSHRPHQAAPRKQWSVQKKHWPVLLLGLGVAVVLTLITVLAVILSTQTRATSPVATPGTFNIQFRSFFTFTLMDPSPINLIAVSTAMNETIYTVKHRPITWTYGSDLGVAQSLGYRLDNAHFGGHVDFVSLAELEAFHRELPTNAGYQQVMIYLNTSQHIQTVHTLGDVYYEASTFYRAYFTYQYDFSGPKLAATLSEAKRVWANLTQSAPRPCIANFESDMGLHDLISPTAPPNYHFSGWLNFNNLPSLQMFFTWVVKQPSYQTVVSQAASVVNLQWVVGEAPLVAESFNLRFRSSFYYTLADPSPSNLQLLATAVNQTLGSVVYQPAQSAFGSDLGLGRSLGYSKPNSHFGGYLDFLSLAALEAFHRELPNNPAFKTLQNYTSSAVRIQSLHTQGNSDFKAATYYCALFAYQYNQTAATSASTLATAQRVWANLTQSAAATPCTANFELDIGLHDVLYPSEAANYQFSGLLMFLSPQALQQFFSWVVLQPSYLAVTADTASTVQLQFTIGGRGV